MAEFQIPEEALPGHVPDEAAEIRRMPPTSEVWLAGNQIERLAKMLIEFEPAERGYWFDAVYVPKFDVTRINVSLSRAAHRVTLAHFLEGQEYQLIDYEELEHTNLEDLHMIDEDLGLI